VVELKTARFAVILVETDMENVWIFETRTEAEKHFKKVMDENDLSPCDDIDVIMQDPIYAKSHAWSQTGAHLFITHVNNQTL